MAIQSTTLLGSSSGRNAGDAALISGIMEAVDAACGRQLVHEVPTIKPSYIQKHYTNCRARAIPMLPWNMSLKMLGFPTYNSMRRTGVSLIFDAILFDRALYNPLFNFMSTLYLLMPIVKRKGGKLAMYNVGTGPVTTPAGKKILRELGDMMDFITVRDQASYDILKEIGVTNPRMLIGADAALNCRASDDATANRILEEVGLDPNGEIFAVNINMYLDTWAGHGGATLTREKFLQLYAGALNRLGKELGVPFLFVCTQHSDVELTKALMPMVTTPPKKALITNVEHSHYDVKAALSKVSLLFAMRLHCMILASGSHTPILGMAYQPKIHHYFEAVKLAPGYVLDFKGLTEQSLYEHMLMGWNKRDAIRSHLRAHIPGMQKKAYKAAELVAAIDREENMDAAFARIAAE